MGNRTPAFLTDNEQGSVVTRNNEVGQDPVLFDLAESGLESRIIIRQAVICHRNRVIYGQD